MDAQLGEWNRVYRSLVASRPRRDDWLVLFEALLEESRAIDPLLSLGPDPGSRRRNQAGPGRGRLVAALGLWELLALVARWCGQGGPLGHPASSVLFLALLDQVAHLDELLLRKLTLGEALDEDAHR